MAGPGHAGPVRGDERQGDRAALGHAQDEGQPGRTGAGGAALAQAPRKRGGSARGDPVSHTPWPEDLPGDCSQGAGLREPDPGRARAASETASERPRASRADLQVSTIAFNVRSRPVRSEEHTSELQSRQYLVCRLLLEKKKKQS